MCVRHIKLSAVLFISSRLRWHCLRRQTFGNLGAKFRNLNCFSAADERWIAVPVCFVESTGWWTQMDWNCWSFYHCCGSLLNRLGPSLPIILALLCQRPFDVKHWWGFVWRPPCVRVFSASVHVMYFKEWRGFGRPYLVSTYNIYILHIPVKFSGLFAREYIRQCFKWCVSLDMGLLNVNNEILGKTRLFVFGEKTFFPILRVAYSCGKTTVHLPHGLTYSTSTPYGRACELCKKH